MYARSARVEFVDTMEWHIRANVLQKKLEPELIIMDPVYQKNMKVLC